MAAKDTAYIALDTATAELKSGTVTVSKGKAYPANHPLVKFAPELFEVGSPFDYEIERATAAPGEKRGE
jgi:hypothetical protein